MSDRPIQVLIIDDSALVRQVVSRAIAGEAGIEVMATASNTAFAMERMRQRWPDVVILDIEMPRMDGLSFLRKLMSERPTPVIICSSLAMTGSGALTQALAAGAVSIVSKPKSGLNGFLEDAANDIIAAIRAAARAKVGLPRRPDATSRPLHPAQALLPERRALNTADVILPAGTSATLKTTDQVIAIGTSTGGTQALEAVLTRLPVTVAGLVAVSYTHLLCRRAC